MIVDWYYVFFPKPAVYSAPWPSVIKTTREALSDILRRGTEYNSSWNLTIAEREAAAQARLSRREMRRVRMWRRQEQEAIARGHIMEDVGIRRKQEGMGVKKKSKQAGPGVGSAGVKALRAPVRNAFRDGHPSSTASERTSPASRPKSTSEDNKSDVQPTPKQPPAKLRSTKNRSTSERKPASLNDSNGPVIISPPDQSVLSALRSQRQKRDP